MGIFSVFRAGKAPKGRASKASATAPLPTATLPHAQRTRHSHAYIEFESAVPARPLALRGPKGKFSLTPSGCGNEPEFNAFFYDDGKVAFYYYACQRPNAGRAGVLVHNRSLRLFSAMMTPLSPKDEKRVQANISWLLTYRDLLQPQLKLTRAQRPVKVEFIW